jgi:ribosomal protein S17
MTNPYINPFGEGYEEAMEPGPEVECFNPTCSCSKWSKNSAFNINVSVSDDFKACSYKSMIQAKNNGWLYRQPIRLRVGEHYLNRGGVEDEIIRINEQGGAFKYISRRGLTYSEKGEWVSVINKRDLITHLPREYWGKTKEEKMDNTITVKNATLTLDEAIALGKEAESKKKAIEAENEIKAGDFFWYDGVIRCCRERYLSDGRVFVRATDAFTGQPGGMKKITTPAHIQALKEIYEGMK